MSASLASWACKYESPILSFRHTFATRLIGQGTDIVAVKELLGHAEIKTTLRYAHTNREAKRTAVAKLGVKTVTNGPAKKRGLV